MLQSLESQKLQPIHETFLSGKTAHFLNDFDTRSLQRQEITTESLDCEMNQNVSEDANNETQLPLSTSGVNDPSI